MTEDPEAFDYDRSPGWQDRTFEEHIVNVIGTLRSMLANCRAALDEAATSA